MKLRYIKEYLHVDKERTKYVYRFLFLFGLILILTTFTENVFAQGFGINSTNSLPDSSAMLDVSATNKGMLVPRMSTAQRVAITKPANGLLVFDLTEEQFYFYNSNTTSWNAIAGSGGVASGPVGAIQFSDSSGGFSSDSNFVWDKTNSNLGIGISTPNNRFHLNTTTPSEGIISGRAFVGNWSATAWASFSHSNFNTNTGYAIVQASDGRLFLNSPNLLCFRTQNNAVNRITIFGDGNVVIGSNTNTGSKFQVGNPGDGSVAIANAWTIFSDVRLKKNIKTYDSTLNKLLSVRGVTYNFKDPNVTCADTCGTQNNDTSLQIGVIAQELELVYPEFVDTDDDGYKSVDYSRLSIPAIVAIKELYAIIEELKSRIEVLESQ